MLNCKAQKMSEEDRLLTPAQAGEYLGVSIGSLYQRVRRKELAVIKLGRLLRFRKSDLEKILIVCDPQ